MKSRIEKFTCVALLMVAGCSPKADPTLNAPIKRPEPELALNLKATAEAPNSQEIHISVLDSSEAKILRIPKLSIEAFEDEAGNRIGKMKNFSWRHQPNTLDADDDQGPIELRMIFQSTYRGTIGRLFGTLQLTTGTKNEIRIPIQELKSESDARKSLSNLGIDSGITTSSKFGINLKGENVVKIADIVLVDAEGNSIQPNLKSGSSTRFTWGWSWKEAAPEDFRFRILLKDDDQAIDWNLRSSTSNTPVQTPRLNIDGTFARMNFFDVNIEDPKGVLLAAHILDAAGQIASTKPRVMKIGLGQRWTFSAPTDSAEALRVFVGEDSKDLAVDLDLKDIEVR